MDGMGSDKMNQDELVLFRKKPRGCFPLNYDNGILWLWDEGYFIGLVIGETGPLNS